MYLWMELNDEFMYYVVNYFILKYDSLLQIQK